MSTPYPTGQAGYPPQPQYYPQPGPPGQPQNQYYPQPGQPDVPQNQYYPQPGQPGYPPNQYYPQPGQPGQAIVMQPMSGGGGAQAGWMPAPAVPVNCPPGLEYLGHIDQLIVKQKMEILEAFTGFETNNKYEVLNSMGQRVYYAVEDTCCCTRLCCGSVRPFDIKVLDNNRREVMHLERPLRCSCCLCPCCLQKMEVQAPPGSIIGYVRQSWSCCHPRYKINNAEDKTMLRIKGPLCQCNICGDINFKVYSADGVTRVGEISKQWSGLAKEVFTDSDNFGVTFPMNMDIATKATVLGAVFLIDFMYFESDQGDVKKEAKRLK